MCDPHNRPVVAATHAGPIGAGSVTVRHDSGTIALDVQTHTQSTASVA